MGAARGRGGTVTGSRGAAHAAVLLGTLAVVAIPAGVAASQYLTGIELVRAVYVAVPVAVLLALGAVGASRRARFALASSVRPDRGARLVRAGRALAWTGMYVGITGALALGVFGVLRLAQ